MCTVQQISVAFKFSVPYGILRNVRSRPVCGQDGPWQNAIDWQCMLDLCHHSYCMVEDVIKVWTHFIHDYTLIVLLPQVS